MMTKFWFAVALIIMMIIATTAFAADSSFVAHQRHGAEGDGG